MSSQRLPGHNSNNNNIDSKDNSNTDLNDLIKNPGGVSSSKFTKQGKVEELKKAFKFKNKVSTMESYEKKKNDHFSVFSNPHIQIPSI